MNSRNRWIEALASLSKWLDVEDESLEGLIEYAGYKNPWFTQENIRKALRAIRNGFLDEQKLRLWLQDYPPKSDHSAVVGLILAGNIPMVGFHDLLCVLLSGHRAMVKLSSKDDVLIPALLQKACEQDQDLLDQSSFVERLSGFDAIIATGSNQSSIYFTKYFDKYPHIIRKNRNAVAVLDGTESEADLKALGEDIFSFFGLGCRNVSKIYIPVDYEFTTLISILNQYRDILKHEKYANNYEYNLATFIINRINYLSNDCLILLESDEIASRIGTLHFSYYHDLADIKTQLVEEADKIQCVVSHLDLGVTKAIPFGSAQEPLLNDYADGVDTMQFLAELNTREKI